MLWWFQIDAPAVKAASVPNIKVFIIQGHFSPSYKSRIELISLNSKLDLGFMGFMGLWASWAPWASCAQTETPPLPCPETEHDTKEKEKNNNSMNADLRYYSIIRMHSFPASLGGKCRSQPFSDNTIQPRPDGRVQAYTIINRFTSINHHGFVRIPKSVSAVGTPCFSRRCRDLGRCIASDQNSSLNLRNSSCLWGLLLSLYRLSEGNTP